MIIALALAVIAVAGAELWRRSQPNVLYAKALKAGYAHPTAVPDPDVGSQMIGENANAAGYRWAESRGITMGQISDCARFWGDFRAGCEDREKEQGGGR